MPPGVTPRSDPPPTPPRQQHRVGPLPAWAQWADRGEQAAPDSPRWASPPWFLKNCVLRPLAGPVALSCGCR